MRPEIIGHRGARAHYPENTVQGCQSAIGDGVRHFEIDVGMTRDGVVVLSHDPRLNPVITRDGSGAWHHQRPCIAGLDVAALQAFDVGRIRPGTAYHRAFPSQGSLDGVRIPTLDAVLRLDGTSCWMIEVKTSPTWPARTAPPETITDAVVAAAEAAGALRRVVVQSFDWRVMRHLRRRRPDVRCAWLTCAATRAWRGGQRPLPATVAAEGGDTWAPNHAELTWRRFAAARDLGLRVIPWTVNEPHTARRLAAWGVDGLITDDPVAMRDWLRFA